MNVTLNKEQLAAFIQWSENSFRKNGQKGIITRLTELGMEDIIVEGRGNKATYTFNVPETYWMMLVVPTKHSTVGSVQCMQAIMNGNKADDGLVDFDMNIIDKIAKEQCATFDAIEKTYINIKSHLKEHGYIVPGKRSHRVKGKEDGQWFYGGLGKEYHEKARSIWKKFYEQIREQISQVVPNVDDNAVYTMSRPFAKAKMHKMSKELGVYAYTTTRERLVDAKLNQDIEYARTTFLNTLDMSVVRSEINSRQLAYKQEVVSPVLTDTLQSGLTKEQRSVIAGHLERAAAVNLI
ncbi:hypothetical protein ACQVSN_26985 [Bacillus mobilis]|uniref:hypothetical protein n=1 Tax=Bacillus mobilis TaxID=2026190 RepID=UPI003D655423